MEVEDYLACFPFTYRSYKREAQTNLIVSQVRFTADFGEFPQGGYVDELFIDYRAMRMWSFECKRDIRYQILPAFNPSRTGPCSIERVEPR